MNSKLFNPIKNKIAASIALLFFVLLGAGTMMAMKASDGKNEPSEKKHAHVKPKIVNKQAVQTWYFNGSTSAQVMTATNYGSSPTKTCNGSDVYPCEIQFDASQYTTPTTNTPLQNYLNAEGDATTVKDDAISVRSN